MQWLLRVIPQCFEHRATTSTRRGPTLCQRGLQHSLNMPQVFQAAIDLGQAVFDERLDIAARERFSVVVVHELLHVVQRKADGLSGSDEFEPT